MTSSPQAKPFDWTNLRLRILSAVILVPLALAAVWVGEALFLVLTAVAVALLSIEWALMAAPDQPTPAAGVMTVAVLAPMFAAYYGEGAWAWLALPVAAGRPRPRRRGRSPRRPSMWAQAFSISARQASR